jgi:hypothetical protein
MSRHAITPVSSNGFTAASFSVKVNTDSDCPLTMNDIKVRFFNSGGEPGTLPGTASPSAVLSAVATLAAAMGSSSENMQATVKRLSPAFVSAVYGVTVTS